MIIIIVVIIILIIYYYYFIIIVIIIIPIIIIPIKRSVSPACDHTVSPLLAKSCVCPLRAVPIDRRVFEIGVIPTPRAVQGPGTCAPGHSPPLVRGCLLSARTRRNMGTPYQVMRVRSRSRAGRLRIGFVPITLLFRALLDLPLDLSPSLSVASASFFHMFAFRCLCRGNFSF